MEAKRPNVVDQFKELLSEPVINLNRLRKMCFNGCPDVPGIRATCWKLLLNYLPPERGRWVTVLQKQRFLQGQRNMSGRLDKCWTKVSQKPTFYYSLMELYKHYVKETIIIPQYNDADEQIDHPLNTNPESNWNKYFQDNETLTQIDHDARRLYPDISFFQLPTPYPCRDYKGTVMGMHTLKGRVEQTILPSQIVESTRQGIRNLGALRKMEDCVEPHAILKEGQEAHWEVVERILFIHTKVHKGLGYIQGMNEICGPIYYVFASQSDKESQEYAEADAFFCFSCIMIEIGDKFNKFLDSSPTGYKSALNQMMKLLKRKDLVLHNNLVKKDIDPQFFGFRWITLLLSQEFLLPEVIQVWDTFLADSNRFEFVIYVSCAMILCIKEELMKGDFGENILLLQNYSLNNVDLRKILRVAKDLRDFYPLSKCV